MADPGDLFEVAVQIPVTISTTTLTGYKSVLFEIYSQM
jgi:hypothetical protein